MFTQQESALVLIDIQGKLAESMQEREALFDNLVRLTRSAALLQLPILWVEQSPEKMGRTIAPLAELLSGHEAIAKTSFSCCGEPAFMQALKQSGRRQLILTGIECHVCVFQTAANLLAAGYEVQTVADAVSSRTLANRQIGLERMRALGAQITSTEMLLFELMKTANHPQFRDIAKLVR
ncbi:MAG: Vibriobactin-specific isochorismatase [Betaproteobacteria bacterium ADurb.Bin341]|nr:MAG: Vibriobactin-specific isochorismatase [Betaproteobacteria bacterium ADurb.Bin341]